MKYQPQLVSNKIVRRNQHFYLVNPVQIQINFAFFPQKSDSKKKRISSKIKTIHKKVNFENAQNLLKLTAGKFFKQSHSFMSSRPVLLD